MSVTQDQIPDNVPDEMTFAEFVQAAMAVAPKHAAKVEVEHFRFSDGSFTVKFRIWDSKLGLGAIGESFSDHCAADVLAAYRLAYAAFRASQPEETAEVQP